MVGGVLSWYKQSHTYQVGDHGPINNYITEALPQEWELWMPHQVPQPRGLALGGGSPKHLALKASGACGQELHRAWGNRLHSLRVHTRFHVPWIPEWSRDSLRIWVGPTWGSWMVSWESKGQLWLIVGAGHWRQRSQEYLSMWAPLEAAILEKPGSSHGTDKPQAKQQAGWEHSPTTHQQTAA